MLLCLATMLTGCKTKERLVEVVRVDSTIVSHNYRDSIYVHDSIYITERGDTVRIEKWHTRWRDRVIHDTCYTSHTDSVPVPYPVIQEVQRQVTWWEHTLVYSGIVFWMCVVLAVEYGLWRLWRKVRG